MENISPSGRKPPRPAEGSKAHPPSEGSTGDVSTDSTSGSTPDQAQQTQPVAETVPAGWYPDPDNAARNRYWDGAAWTTEYAEHQQQVQPQQPVARDSTGMLSATQEYKFYHSSVRVDDHDLTIRRKFAPGLPKELRIPLSTIRGAYFVPAQMMSNGRLKIVTSDNAPINVQSNSKSANDPHAVIFLKKHASLAEGLYAWLVEIGHYNGWDLPVIATQEQADLYS